MSDDEKIIKLLQDDGAPELGADAARRIAARATSEFIRTRPAAGGGFLHRFMEALSDKPLRLAGGFAVIALLCFFAWQGMHRGDSVVVAARDLDREKIVLAEFNELFGGRLQAVISTGGQTQIVLGEKDAQHGQPVVIHLSEKGQTVDIMSFSGENLQVSIGGRQVNFETLVDGQGGVILAGEKLFWQGGKASPGGAADLKIEAKALEM